VTDLLFGVALGAVGAVGLFRVLPRVRRRLVCWLVRAFARVGLIKVPYGDYDAAMGRAGGDDS